MTSNLAGLPQIKVRMLGFQGANKVSSKCAQAHTGAIDSCWKQCNRYMPAPSPRILRASHASSGGSTKANNRFGEGHKHVPESLAHALPN